MVLIAETLKRELSAKRHSLIYRAEVIFTIYGARSHKPIGIRRSSINHLHQWEKTPEGVISLVEVVGVEPTSYAAAKKLSTYLVYLLFLTFTTRVNTLCKPQEAKYSYKNTSRFL